MSVHQSAVLFLFIFFGFKAFALPCAPRFFRDDGPRPIITSLQDWQVLQRSPLNNAMIPVTGVVPGGADCVDLAVVDEATSEVLLDWVVIGWGDSFSYNLPFQQGGLYQLIVRVWKNGAVGFSTVNHLGIGEVLIIVGQSNACNSGQTPFASDNTVSVWNGQGYQQANDPQPPESIIGSGGSVWALTGSLLTRQWKVPVGFINLAVPGSSVFSWIPGANQNYPRLRAVLQMLRPYGGVRGVLYAQGETDTALGTSTRDYEQRLTSIITQSQVDAGYPHLWFVAIESFGGLKWGNPANRFLMAHQRQIQAAQWAVIQKNFALPGANTDCLSNGMNPAPFRQGDNIHFSTQGQQAAAGLWGNAITSVIK